MKSRNKLKKILKVAGNNNETENRLWDVANELGLIPAWKHRIFCASICINISSVESNTKCRIKSSAIIRFHWIFDNWLDTREISGNVTFTLWCYKIRKWWKDSLSQVQKKAFWDKKKGKKGWMEIWGRNRLFYNGSWKDLWERVDKVIFKQTKKFKYEQ